MKRKIIAFLLAMTMVLGLVGCGSKEKSASLVDTQKELQEVNSGEFSMEFAIKANMSDTSSSTDSTSQLVYQALKSGINIKLDGVVESATKADMNISYNLGDGKYVNLTQFIVNDDTVYINLKKIKEFVASIPQFATYASFVPADKDYLKISKSDIENYAKSAGVTESTTSLPTQDTVEVYKIAGLQICQFIDDAAKDVDPAVVKNDDGKIVISINEKNVKAFIDNAKKLDVAKYYDAFLEEGNKLDGDKTLVGKAKDAKSDAVSSIKKALKEASESLAKKDSKDKFSLDMDINTTGKKGSYKVEENIKFKVTSDKDSAEVSAKYSINQKTDKKVTAPKDAMTLEEFATAIQSLFGSFQGTGSN